MCSNVAKERVSRSVEHPCYLHLQPTTVCKWMPKNSEGGGGGLTHHLIAVQALDRDLRLIWFMQVPERVALRERQLGRLGVEDPPVPARDGSRRGVRVDHLLGRRQVERRVVVDRDAVGGPDLGMWRPKASEAQRRGRRKRYRPVLWQSNRRVLIPAQRWRWRVGGIVSCPPPPSSPWGLTRARARERKGARACRVATRPITDMENERRSV